MKYFNIKRATFFLTASALVAFGLAACGGGGGGVATPEVLVPPVTTPEVVAPPVTPPVVAAGIAYTGFFEDSVSSATVTFTTDNSIALGSKTYKLTTTANGGCTFNSSPAEPDALACSQLAGGEAYLFCNGITGYSFDTVLFKSSVVDASIGELRGLTLPLVSCGSPAIRILTDSVSFDSVGGSVQTLGGGSNTWNASIMSQVTSATGVRLFSFQTRVVVRKLVQSSKTTYFVMFLRENVAGTAETYAPSIYVLDVNK